MNLCVAVPFAGIGGYAQCLPLSARRGRRPWEGGDHVNYTSPELTFLGSLTQLTLGNGGSQIDGNCDDDQRGDPSVNGDNCPR